MVLFGCWIGNIDVLVRWLVSRWFLVAHVFMMARDFHLEGSELKLRFCDRIHSLG